MERTFDLAHTARHTALGFGVVFAIDFNDVTVFVLLTAGTLDDVCTLETHFFVGRKAEIFLGRILHKVVALDIDFAAERHFVGTTIRVFRIVLHFDIFDSVFGIVGDNDFHGVEHGTHARCFLVKVFTDAEFEERNVVDSLKLGITDASEERFDRIGRKTATAQTADGRHTRVVPTVDETFFDELEKFALAQHCVCQVESVELNLTWAIRFVGKKVDKVVVKRTVRHKFECTNRVSNAFEIVRLTMSEVVHRIYLPPIAGAMVRVLDDAIHNRVAEVHIRRCHIDFCAQHH